MPTDPILYPLPRGTAESLRQDIYRSRADLVDTAAALGARLNPRREAARLAGTLGRAAAPLAGGVAAGTLAAYAGRSLGRRRGLRRLATILATAGGYLVAHRAVRRRPARGTVAGDVSVVAPGDILAVDEAPRSPAVVAQTGPGAVDVVDVLIAQHRNIENLFERAATAPAAMRTEAFAALVEFLNKHEHTEQEIVHAELRSLGGDAAMTAEGRLDEERLADRALASLVHRGIDDGGFQEGLAHLRAMVRAHARHEEAEEFPLLRANLPASRLQGLANQVNAAQTEPY